MKTKAEKRLDRQSSPTLQNWKTPAGKEGRALRKDVSVDLGTGRLLFAHTFANNNKLLSLLKKESKETRNIGFYVRDPHVLLAEAPQELFLDPSHTFRIWFNRYLPRKESNSALLVRRLTTPEDVEGVQTIYAKRKMVIPGEDFLYKSRNSRKVFPLLIEDASNGEILGTVVGIDHVQVFGDPENGSSLWSLAVDPQASIPGVGESLVRFLCEYFIAKGRDFMDLSVMHDNSQAIQLYEKLDFERVPVFCVKRKNPINEPLFRSPQPDETLNPYAQIIINEARRRGVRVDVIDEEAAIFSLSFGGRAIICRESLTELTNALTMTICDDKRLTQSILSKAGLNVPAQQVAGTEEENRAFLSLHEQIVIKPARGEQGAGIAVDVRDEATMKKAIEKASEVSPKVLLEEYRKGLDLRIVVINFEVVAAAIRKPAEVIGSGTHSIKQLIEKQSRRRQAATGGESRIPLDEETKRCIAASGYTLEDVLPKGEVLQVRNTANLHTGGILLDVTDQISPFVRQAAQEAAKALNIPVTGLDFLVPDCSSEDYCIIEANERPGLDNHQPQPTAERFIDFLFPESGPQSTQMD